MEGFRVFGGSLFSGGWVVFKVFGVLRFSKNINSKVDFTASRGDRAGRIRVVKSRGTKLSTGKLKRVAEAGLG